MGLKMSETEERLCSIDNGKPFEFYFIILIGLCFLIGGIFLFLAGVWGIGGIFLSLFIGVPPIIVSSYREYRLKPKVVIVMENQICMRFVVGPDVLIRFSDIRKLSMKRQTTIGLKDERHLYASGRLYPYIIPSRLATDIKAKYEKMMMRTLPGDELIMSR